MRRPTAALAVLAAAACAAGVAVGATGGGGAASPATVRLTVAYDDGTAAPVRRATLRCGRRAEGTRWLAGDARRACRTARAQVGVLTGPRSDGPCTQLFGGPQTARVAGRVGARTVARTFSRQDGCRIAEWDALRPLLPRTRGAAPAP